MSLAGTARIGQALRALAGSISAHWSRERRDTLFLLFATALTVAPHASHLPLWASVIFFLLFGWRFALVLSGRQLPGSVVLGVAGIACLAGVLAQYHTLVGREPAVTVLVLMLGLKLMEMRARRDLFVVTYLCFFVLLTLFFYTQTPLAAAAALLAVTMVVATMLTMQYGAREAPFARRLRSALLIIFQALPLAALLFVLFPRLQTPLWGSPEDAPGARTGLSDTMRPGAVASLAESEEVALRVSFEGATPQRRLLYWRGPVLSEFDGATWSEQRPGAQSTAGPLVEVGSDSAALAYTVTLEPTNHRWLLALDVPTALEPVAGALPGVSAELTVYAARPIVRRTSYRFQSHTSYLLGRDESAPALAAALQLPAGYNPRSRELAASWRSAAPDARRIVAQALDLFGQEPFRYTLRPPLLGRDGVDEFLFTTRAGFCEHYAAAFVVLMRAAGVPARVVTGYQGGEPDQLSDEWLVRQSDAHAWAEVWLADEGWVRIDPTGAVAPGRIELGERAQRAGSPFDFAFDPNRSFLGTLTLSLDALGRVWSEWVLSYETGHQKRLLARLGFSFDSWEDLASLLTGTLLLLIAAVALFTLHPRPPRDPVQAAYLAFCARLAAHGLRRADHESAVQLLARARASLEPERFAQARRIVALYNALRYAHPAESTPGVRHLRRLVRSFR